MKTKMEKNQRLRTFKKQLPLHGFVLAGLIFLLLFSLIPMVGVIIAFEDYDIKSGFTGIFTSQFVGLKHFKAFLTDRKFPILMRNTLCISVLKLILSFPLPIIFAIMISEMGGKVYKRVVQTVSYLPHFFSWIIVSGILFTFFSTNTGLINEILMKLGVVDKPIPILMDPKYYYPLAVFSEIWKETGWGAIIYLAAIAGISPTLYESARIDGAGRMQCIRHITLPSIKGTVAILLILAIGGLFGSNFDQAMLLGNTMNLSRSEILEVFIYKIGLGQGRYSFAAAAGLFQSVISFILVLSANAVSKKVSGSSLF